MFEFITDEEERGQVGIGTLIVFIAMVLVAAIAAGVLINTAGLLQSTSQQAGQQSSDQVTNRLEPVSKTGNVTTMYQVDNGTLYESEVNDSTEVEAVDNVSFVIQKSPGAGDINVGAATGEFLGPDGTDRFNFSASGVSFEVLKDDDDSLSGDTGGILNSKTDRLVVTLSLSNEATFEENSEMLGGETATLRLNTESGSTSIIRIGVPESLSGESSVEV